MQQVTPALQCARACESAAGEGGGQETWGDVRVLGSLIFATRHSLHYAMEALGMRCVTDASLVKTTCIGSAALPSNYFEFSIMPYMLAWQSGKPMSALSVMGDGCEAPLQLKQTAPDVGVLLVVQGFVSRGVARLHRRRGGTDGE